MRITQCVLVVADISGYTRFITHRAVSLKHAEQIVTELMESIIDRAQHPLKVNKLEGDAALLFADAGPSTGAACASVLAQVYRLRTAFTDQLARIRTQRRHCECHACANVGNLKLKFVVHVDEVAIKQVRQFEELAGEGVILVHRLLKNSVDRRDYVLLTTQFRDALENAPEGEWHSEDVEGIGECRLFLCELPADDDAATPAAGIARAGSSIPPVGADRVDGPGLPAESGAAVPPNPARARKFTHLPDGERGFLPWLRDAIDLVPKHIRNAWRDRS